ncbi:acetyl-CoA carboxylase, carboxyltransferase subunit beta [Alphaproteobacteria bacterium]|nr:acetyl-CoA carboxylase, carboxyltransferase subunit beta [Alphaproteobacteria bacterium]
MSWLSNFVRPKIRALIKKSDTPNNLWIKCNGCEQMVYHKDLKETLSVCPTCNHHMKMSASQRMNWILDEETIKEIIISETISDPLKFKDNKKYTDRLKVSKEKTQNDDAIIIASGKIGGNNAVVAALDFNFMGGSMGVAVGEGFLAAAKEAVGLNAPLVVFTSSGGARMQEGIFSLMQLPRTVIAVNKLKENSIPYIVVLTDPTTGGVSASFAMLGDVTYAEPGALIGFAGPRVIQSTVHETLPEGFQTSEYLLEHGMIDDVISRKNLKAVIANTIMHLVNNVSAQSSLSH